jgi:muramidase (phage lysozyme)
MPSPTTAAGLNAEEMLRDNPEAAACVAAIYAGESRGDYRILCGGRAFQYNDGHHFNGFETFPHWDGLRGPWGVSHAAGAGQFEPKTWAVLQVELGLPDFSPHCQDIATFDLAFSNYGRVTKRNLLDDLKAGRLSEIAPALHSTWTSLSAKTFGQRYYAALRQVKGKPSPDTEVHPVLHTTGSLTVGGSVASVLAWVANACHVPMAPHAEEALGFLLTIAGAWALHRILLHIRNRS